MYPRGVGCACLQGQWICSGGDACPATAVPGDSCTELVGQFCDYPMATPHMMCMCLSYPDDILAVSWICPAMPKCPSVQPSYPATCTAYFAFCPYQSGRVLCSCPRSSSSWVCDWPFMFNLKDFVEPDAG